MLLMQARQALHYHNIAKKEKHHCFILVYPDGINALMDIHSMSSGA